MAWETEIPDVIAGEPIESAWGNQIRDQVVHIVPVVGALPATADDGGVAYVEATDLLYLRRSGVWIAQGGGGGVLGVAFQTAVQTGITTTPVQITGLLVAVSVPVGTTRRLRISGQIQVQTATGVQAQQIALRDGGTQIQQSAMYAATGDVLTHNPSIVVSATSGGHSYTMFGNASASTMSIVASSTIPSYLLVEDLGPV